MTAIAFYLLKVFVCSGILMLYYLLALKDKAFHQWNRFYLLSAVALSIALPLVQIVVTTAAEKNTAIQLLQVVQSADDYLDAITVSSQSHISTEQAVTVAYAFASLLFLVSLILSLIKIRRLAQKWGVQKVEGIRFINTAEPGTPFSFLRSIFWNRDIPLYSETGRQIFQHELVHVKEKHTLDKLFLQAVLIVFWCNPFYWLIKKELRFIHEFIADKQSVSEAGTATFAAMILQAAYPLLYSSIVNPFFQTSIKRRLAMLTKKQNPLGNYLSRIVALPIMSLVVFAFTLRTKEIPKIVKLDREFVVVVDAGHGKVDGRFTGANDGNVYEDELALSLVKKISQLNTNPNIKIIFTRSDDNIVELKQRVAIAQEAKADLFLSIHLNAVPNTTFTQQALPKEKEGMQIYVPSGNAAYSVQSRVLGSSVVEELSSFYKTNATLISSQRSIYVLNAAPCPAVLIECGTLNDAKDKAFISSPDNQEKFAKHILAAIERYATVKEKATSSRTDTLPKKEIASVDVNRAKSLLTISYTDGSCETITEQEANNRGLINNGGYGNIQKAPLQKPVVKTEIRLKDSSVKPLLVINGEIVSNDLMNAIDPTKIESINVLKGPTATAKYGTKGENGVIEMKTKRSTSLELESVDVTSSPAGKDNLSAVIVQGKPLKDGAIPADASNSSAAKKDLSEVTVIGYPSRREPIFEQTETPASIDKNEWLSFLSTNAQPIIDEMAKKGAKPGTYVANVRFLVEKDGSLSEVKILNKIGYDADNRIANMMKASPKWNPAQQNGNAVRSYHTQPISFMISAGQ